MCLSIPGLVLRAEGWSLAAAHYGVELNCWAELLGGSNQGGLAAAKEIAQSGKCLKQKREDLPLKSACEGCSDRQGIPSHDLGGLGEGLAEKLVDYVTEVHLYTLLSSWQKPVSAAITPVICNIFPLGVHLCTCSATSCYVGCGILNSGLSVLNSVLLSCGHRPSRQE